MKYSFPKCLLLFSHSVMSDSLRPHAPCQASSSFTISQSLLKFKSIESMTPIRFNILLDQFSSVTQSCPTLCDPMDCSTPGFPVHHELPAPAQTHVHWVGNTIQPSHLLLSPSSPIFNHSQHQGLFQWVSLSHQVAKVLEFYLQNQFFQWIFRTDFL